MTPEQKVDVVHEAAKSAPPAAISAASVLTGFTLHEWMAIATIVYIALQAGWLVWKWRRAANNKQWMPE